MAVEGSEAGPVPPSDGKQMGVGDRPVVGQLGCVGRDGADDEGHVVGKEDVRGDLAHLLEQPQRLYGSDGIGDGIPVRQHPHEPAFSDRGGSPTVDTKSPRIPVGSGTDGAMNG